MVTPKLRQKLSRFKKIQTNLRETRSHQISDYFSDSANAVLKVLLVENEKIHQITFSSQLKTLGIVPDLAKNGSEAIELVMNNDYNFIFMDFEMPGLNGVETTKRIKTLDTSSIIIGYTTLNDQQSVLKGIHAGMEEILIKPARTNEIVKTMNKYLNKIAQIKT